MSMGRSLSLWIVYLLVVSIFVAYVIWLGTAPGAGGTEVFRRTAAMAWIVYGGGAIPGSIWEGKPWSFAIKGVVDAFIYALIAGAVFAWLWPDVAA
jgi:hypothetical protein